MGQLLQLLELLSPHKDLLLGHLNNGAIKVLEEQAALLKHAVVNLEDLNEVNRLLFAVLVSDFACLRKDDIVSLLCSCDHPLQVLYRDFMVEWDKEGLIGSG